MNDKTKLGGLFYPTRDQAGRDIPFDSLFIPYIYREIYFEGVYVDILNQQKDMIIVDVGANIGVTVDHFRKHAKKLYAIEPSPEHFAALEMNKKFNRWNNVELFNYALADKDGEMEFKQAISNRTMNSLMVGKGVVDKHGAETIIMPGRYNEESLMVKTKSIDHFFEENNIDKVDFMKFDPEGAEEIILRSEGFKKIASKVKAIMVEFHFPNWMELVKYMEELGFTPRRYESSAIIVLFTR